MNSRPLALGLGLLLMGGALGLLGLCVGSQGLDDALWVQPMLITELRLPRSMAAWACGALLGLAGAIAQGLFRNPLADPYLLGASAGASLGVALALVAAGSAGGALLAGSGWSLNAAAFVGAWGALGLTVLLSRGVSHTPRLLLAGVIVGVILAAATQGLTLLDPSTLRPLQHFMLGSTSLLGWAQVALSLPVLALALVLALACSRTLDALGLGEDTARSLGLPLDGSRTLLLALLALCSGTAVAQCGLVAFVGLVAPHMVRALGVSRYRWLLPLAALSGGALLLAADILARWVWAPLELPVGLPTAVLGGAYLLARLPKGQGR
jgi:iron complex transport system permease protein